MVGLLICHTIQAPGGVYGHGDLRGYTQEDVPSRIFSSISLNTFLFRLRIWLLLLNFECLIMWTPSVEKGRQLDAFQVEMVHPWSPPFVI